MASNRRKHTNSMPAAELSRWIIIAFFASAVGLGYVYVKNQLHTAGNQIKSLEGQLADVTKENEVVHSRIASLSSRSTLQRRLNEGFIKMVPITDDRIVRITTAPPVVASNDIRPVSNEGPAK